MEHISFLANPKYKHEVHDSKAGAVIVSDKAAGEFTGRSLIVAADPYLYFAKVARLFSPVVKARGGVHPTAVVEPSATVPDSCEIEILITKADNARVHCDGQSHIDLHSMNRLTIRRYRNTLRVLHPTDYQYYKTLRQKLHWGEQLI